MFLINKSLAVYRQRHPQGETFDASQGDGGASLPGVPEAVLERAAALQREHGSAYDMPYGCDAFRRAVLESYWQVSPQTGLAPGNVLASVGGRDALVKAYTAMLALEHGRVGDLVVVSRVPWISYNWGPYGIGGSMSCLRRDGPRTAGRIPKTAWRPASSTPPASGGGSPA